MDTTLSVLDLPPSLFDEIRRLLHETCGIQLGDGKAGLVKARLMKRLRALDLPTFEAYMRHVRADASGAELTALVDVLTTNKTSFFREPQHFEYLRRHVISQWRAAGRARIWCAGCSSGEEPYSLAMLLRETMSDAADTRILATDISTRVLEHARAGVYGAERLAELPPDLLQRYFEAAPGAPLRSARVSPEVRGLVTFARLNLLHRWPMQGPFDAIFCRNVMIYFDRETQRELVARFAALLRPGGLLFVGHSESLTAYPDVVRYVCPAVYRK